jgi:hypothetical protein
VEAHSQTEGVGQLVDDRVEVGGDHRHLSQADHGVLRTMPVIDGNAVRWCMSRL